MNNAMLGPYREVVDQILQQISHEVNVKVHEVTYEGDWKVASHIRQQVKDDL